jgi:hypothetical protein
MKTRRPPVRNASLKKRIEVREFCNGRMERRASRGRAFDAHDRRTESNCSRENGGGQNDT